MVMELMLPVTVKIIQMLTVMVKETEMEPRSRKQVKQMEEVES